MHKAVKLHQQTADDVMTTPLTTMHHSEVQLPHLLPKNWVVRSLHILHRVS